MKNLRLIGFLMMLASSALFVNCTSDPVVGADGADGADGIDGIDGIPGIDGLDSTADCRSCHSSEHRDPIKASYALSVHAEGGAVGYAGGRASCTRCHSSEGFVNYIDGVAAVDIENPTPISCNTCHSSLAGHRSFDFENDGNDYALRTLAPVQLIVDENIFLDGANESDVMGTSNTCITCHQPRTETPVADADGEFTVTSSHYGPHHGPQSTLLEGIQGYEFSSVGISAAGTAGHKEGSSCIACHMGETTDGTDGAHTWNPTATACLNCHNSEPESVSGYETGMATLGGLLENVVGWEYEYIIDRDANEDPVYAADRDGNLTVLVFLDAVGGDPIGKDDSPVKVLDSDSNPVKQDFIGYPGTGFYGQGVTYTINDAGAGWNYLFLEEDKSDGIHNPDYAKALIAQSIEALQ